ncbi:MAG: FAD-dependent oxidoreductase [Candidatus Colwellbacteria bacterium]|nr:FAD-dependent oxidoreductase [Candidatus Colwellbacteria bacterium]
MKYDVVIIGGGIIGTALLYALSRYTNIPRIALIEKYKNVAQVNSHERNNSQTLHFGDIETNYNLEKAVKVKEAATMLVRYLELYAKDSFIKGGKMVLAVGEREVKEIERRFEEFQFLFPNIKKIYKDELAKLEPAIVKGRNNGGKLAALYSPDGYTVNYKKVSESFVREAKKTDKTVDVYLGTEVKELRKDKDTYIIKTSRGDFSASAVAVMAGPQSLVFAKQLGYGKNLSILPIAGSFYITKNILNMKVYRVQLEKLPFAAIHGDPDINNPQQTRFGPTGKVLPLLERYNYKSISGFLRTSVWNLRGVLSLLKIISNKPIFFYIFRNLTYDIPVLGRWLFLKHVQKIVPSLKYRDLRYGKKIGGIRPQVVDTSAKKLEMGEAEIVGDKILFNITPSPGASVSLKNAEQDALKIIDFLKPAFSFDINRWCRDFGSTMQKVAE